MSPTSKLTQRLRRLGTWLVHVGVFCLFVLGVMNLVHNIYFKLPDDGAHWEMVEGHLTAVALTGEARDQSQDEDDDQDEAQLEIGDVLISINDQEISDDTQRQDYLYRFGMDSKRPLLYRVDHSGSVLSYWIYIRGQRPVGNREFYLFLPTGFVYLLFLLLMLMQDVSIPNRNSLGFLSFCVFLKFVFKPTNSFTSLDWISLYLDRLGGLLLPSAIATVAVAAAMGRSRWRIFIQTIHWVPTLLLSARSILLFARSDTGDPSQYSLLFQDTEQVLYLWSGVLILASILALGLVAELRGREKNLTAFWVIAWLPMAVSFLGLDFPYDQLLVAGLPMLLPLAFLVEWSRTGRLYLGTLGKKVIVYMTVVVLLLVVFALFIITYQALLDATISRNALNTLLGMGIMFAAVTYTPLSHFFAEQLDRLTYGKRFQSIREFSDLTEINRADTNIDDFLFTILNRIMSAFRVVGGCAYKTGEHSQIFRTILPIKEQVTFLLQELPPGLAQGKIVRGHQVSATTLQGEKRNPILPNDYVLPIRVAGQLSALIVFTPQGNVLKLSPEEERLLRTVLRQCDVLMENMELYQAVTQKVNSINQLKEYSENIIESSRLGILTTDDMSRAVSCNSAFLELAGQSREALMGQAFEDIFRARQLVNQRQTKSGFIIEGVFLNSEGQALELEIQNTPLRTRENEVYGTLFLVEDIREKKRFNEKIMQQEKLASIGLLAAGVAHEINTPLTGIASYSQMLISQPGLDEDQRELLDLIQGQSKRAARIVNELLNFSRKGDGPKVRVDLVRVLQQTLRFLGHQIQKRNVSVQVEPAPEPAEIIGYDNQIQQVFVNLIVNAMDAMPEGGTLTVSFAHRAGTVVVSLSDTGVGMDEETRSSIFDPFFTTKEVGKGTGLGLAVVFNILRGHDAVVEVESQLGQGTTFQLSFPRAPRETGRVVVAVDSRL